MKDLGIYFKNVSNIQNNLKFWQLLKKYDKIGFNFGSVRFNHS